MGRLRFVTGAFGIVVGFLVYEYGLFLTLNLWPSLSSETLSFVPWIGSVAVMGALLQLIGGMLGITGLLSCIAWVGSQPKEKSKASGFRRTPEVDVLPVPTGPRCKFCGAVMESDSVFCPKCERSQA